MDINELKNYLNEAWSEVTCVPSLRNEWNEYNPSLGQCAITALIVNDYFGGKIMRCMTSIESHYYNIIEGKIVDLTKEQFLGEIPDYIRGEERTREYLLSNKDTEKRYNILKENLYNLINEEYIKQRKMNRR